MIGLREGLETVVILGAITVFLRHQGRGDQLRMVWMASGAAATICVGLAVALGAVELSLSIVAEQRCEGIVSAVAVATVTYMVIWMRRFPKDLIRDSNSMAAQRFARGSGRAVAVMAFVAVLREGFEITVFVVALVGARTTSPLLSVTGAVAGVLLAVIIGVAVVRGGVRVDIARFFRITGIVLVVSAAGLAMTAIHAANTGGWLVFGQTPQFDWSRLSPPGTVQSAFVSGVFGIQPYPTLIDVVVWLAYLIPMLGVVLWPRRVEASVTGSRRRGRRVAVYLLCEVLALGLVVSVVKIAVNGGSAAAGVPTFAEMPVPAQGVGDGRYLLFRNTVPGTDYGRLGLVAADDPSGARAITGLSCDRVDFEGGLGLCLNLPASGLVVTTTATIFNAHFQVLRQVGLTGFPSRTRVSPDGRYGSVTTFTSGDSYASVGSYSTRTSIIDMRTGRILFDLEQLTVTRDGKPFSNVNFNFWGVTFSTDGHHFYATLGSGAQTYLIKGDLDSRRASVIASNVACPSLSPDGREIAFKRQLPGSPIRWRLSVLDLATGKVRPLAETRSIDDQAEWLDDSTIIYGVDDQPAGSITTYQAAPPGTVGATSVTTGTWSVAADGGGHPHLVSKGTWSEVVTGR
ncbi:MAG: FTR1 family protein [Acidimicrobiales bacterium]